MSDTPTDSGGASAVENTPHQPTSEAFVAVANSAEFGQLRSKFRRFAFPMTAFFIIWYLLYVLLSCYAEGFMSQRIGGSAVTIGLVLGGLQFLTTFVITALYVRHANKTLDPLATQIKTELEGTTQEGVR